MCELLQMFQNLFKEGLEIQKARLREQRTYAKEQQLESQKRHQDRMTSMENYYKDQVGVTLIYWLYMNVQYI